MMLVMDLFGRMPLARGGVDHDAPEAKEASGLALHPQY